MYPETDDKYLCLKYICLIQSPFLCLSFVCGICCNKTDFFSPGEPIPSHTLLSPRGMFCIYLKEFKIRFIEDILPMCLLSVCCCCLVDWLITDFIGVLDLWPTKINLAVLFF